MSAALDRVAEPIGDPAPIGRPAKLLVDAGAVEQMLDELFEAERYAVGLERGANTGASARESSGLSSGTDGDALRVLRERRDLPVDFVVGLVLRPGDQERRAVDVAPPEQPLAEAGDDALVKGVRVDDPDDVERLVGVVELRPVQRVVNDSRGIADACCGDDLPATRIGGSRRGRLLQRS